MKIYVKTVGFENRSPFLYSAENRWQLSPDENDIAGLMAGVKQAKTGCSAILSPFGKGGLAQAEQGRSVKDGRIARLEEPGMALSGNPDFKKSPPSDALLTGVTFTFGTCAIAACGSRSPGRGPRDCGGYSAWSLKKPSTWGRNEAFICSSISGCSAAISVSWPRSASRS